MFLVKDRRFGRDNYVFTWTDPRKDGYQGDVAENIKLDYDMNDIHRWPDGEPRPEPLLGRDRAHPQHYKVFKFPQELQKANFESVPVGTPFVVDFWSDYRRNYYPVPAEYAETMTQDEWFEHLEEMDAVNKLRKQKVEAPEPKIGSTPDQIAEWVARRHMNSDVSIQAVWYLPVGAPADELRLMEVNDQYTSDTAKIEPIGFGLDAGGTKLKLLVADVSMTQLEKIKSNAHILPSGWTINGAKTWGRRQ